LAILRESYMFTLFLLISSQADIAKQDGKPARKSKEAPVPKGRKVTSMGDSGGAKKEGKALGSAGKSLLKSAVGSEDKDKRRLKVYMGEFLATVDR